MRIQTLRKVCVITGARAEYGLLRWVIQAIDNDADLMLQIIATGMHLSPEFGLTYREIEEDGFSIDYKVEMLTSSDTPVGIAKAMGLGMIGFADALNVLKPDLILILGDRFEVFSAASAALVARIPIVHLHGGETTAGAFDESLRHSITKMSHIHFVANEKYRKRVIQMGEQPETVFSVGGLGVDNIMHTKLLTRSELETSLGFKLSKKNLLVTFHPVTLELNTAVNQMQALLDALSELSNTQVVFTLPNADTDGRNLITMINQFVSSHKNAQSFNSLGTVRYLSCIKHFDGVVGNSSSGLLEAPSFNKGTINIGDRQLGRLQAKSVINCEPTKVSIANAIKKLYSSDFQKILNTVTNPYGQGGASEKIVEILKTYAIDNIKKKMFYDLSDIDLGCNN